MWFLFSHHSLQSVCVGKSVSLVCVCLRQTCEVAMPSVSYSSGPSPPPDDPPPVRPPKVCVASGSVFVRQTEAV